MRQLLSGAQWGRGVEGRQSGYQVSAAGSGVLMRKAWHPTPRREEYRPTWLQHLRGFVDQIGPETVERIVLSNGRMDTSPKRKISLHRVTPIYPLIVGP
jgi:hypothetical protein